MIKLQKQFIDLHNQIVNVQMSFSQLHVGATNLKFAARLKQSYSIKGARSRVFTGYFV